MHYQTLGKYIVQKKLVTPLPTLESQSILVYRNGQFFKSVQWYAKTELKPSFFSVYELRIILFKLTKHFSHYKNRKGENQGYVICQQHI